MKPLTSGARARRPYNLWLEVQTCTLAAEKAALQGWSLSELVERLLVKHVRRKEGILGARASSSMDARRKKGRRPILAIPGAKPQHV